MDTPDFFVGARLGTARSKAGIPLEKAAKDTRIRVQRLREIEADDFSGFAHPTYARLFLLDYAEYLGIPQDEIRPLLPDRAGSAGGGFQYIEALSAELPAMKASPRRRRLRILGFIVAVVMLALIAAIGLFTYFTMKKIEAVARSKPLGEQTVPTAVVQEAPPEPTPAPPDATMVASPAPAEEEIPFPPDTERLPVEVPPTTP